MEDDYGSSPYDDDYYNDNEPPVYEEEDDSGKRKVWEVLSWIVLVFTLVLNLLLVGILLVRRNAFSVINKAIFTLGFVDLLYGIFVSPFFVENYVKLHWNQSQDYCKLYEYMFSFHDIFVPLVLILLSTYVSLKFSGASAEFNFKKSLYIVLFIVALVISLLLAIPATVKAAIFIDNPPGGVYKEECRTTFLGAMLLTYCLSSSILFCFTMSFLFSLCIIGSPFLRGTFDREEYTQRWRLLLTLSLVNGLYIVTGFLLNFKEISRLFYKCCEFEEPFLSVDSVTYDVWSFLLLISEPFLRPLAIFGFYSRYLLTDVMSAY
jgi:hypothetical protein